MLPYIAYKLVNKSPSNYSYLRTINIVIGVINQLSYLGGLTLHDIYIYIYFGKTIENGHENSGFTHYIHGDYPTDH